MDKLNFATLISIVSGAAKRRLQPEEIDEIERLTTVSRFPVPFGSGTATEVRTLMVALAEGRKIDAIRSHRFLTGDGLKESKDAIEAITNRYGPSGF